MEHVEGEGAAGAQRSDDRPDHGVTIRRDVQHAAEGDKGQVRAPRLRQAVEVAHVAEHRGHGVSDPFLLHPLPEARQLSR